MQRKGASNTQIMVQMLFGGLKRIKLIFQLVPHHTPLFTNLQCVPISRSNLLFQTTSAANGKPSRLQSSSVSQSGGLFWKSSLVIPCFLCVSSLKPVFRPFSTSPSPLPPPRPLSSTQLLPLLDMLLNLLPSFLLPFPSPSLADLTASAKSFLVSCLKQTPCMLSSMYYI